MDTPCHTRMLSYCCHCVVSCCHESGGGGGDGGSGGGRNIGGDWEIERLG
jgi:hypothetical protein